MYVAFRVFQIVGFLVAMTMVTNIAYADNDREEAQKHFKSGSTLYIAEDFKGAASEFEISVKLFPTKSGLFNLANCYKALHRYGEAIGALKRLLEELGDTLDAQMREKVVHLKSQIEGIVGQLVIRVEPAGALILIDGKSAGRTPLAQPQVVGPGPHSLVVTKEGFEKQERTVVAVSGARQVEEFALSPLRGRLIVKINQPGTSIWIDEKRVGTSPVGEPIELPPGHHSLRLVLDGFEENRRDLLVKAGQTLTLDIGLVAISAVGGARPAWQQGGGGGTVNRTIDKGKPSVLFWAGLGLTGATGAGAGVVFLQALKRQQRFVKYDNLYSNELDDGKSEDWDRKRRDAKADNKVYANVSLGLAIGAGALAVASIVVLVLDLKKNGKPAKGTPVSVVPGGLEVRF
jgi:hypothetical protein